MSSLYDEIQELAALYPEGSRSAALPALRLAQERARLASREAIEEAADALELTPAYCYSVATFYDMFHLEPVGRHIDRGLHEPLRARSCGAQEVVEAFEEELGIRAGETTEDGEITLARSSASAAAATRRSSRSTTATATTSSRRTSPRSSRSSWLS